MSLVGGYGVLLCLGGFKGTPILGWSKSLFGVVLFESALFGSE